LEIYCRAVQVTDVNTPMRISRRAPKAKNTHSEYTGYNNYFFCTAKMVARNSLNVTFIRLFYILTKLT